MQKIEILLQKVKNECRNICDLVDIVPLAFGVEYCVFKATTREWNTVVIRVPWERFSSNDTDGELLSRKGFEKEYLLTQYGFKFGLLVPEIYRHLNISY